MYLEILGGVLLPLLGTTLGAACVFFIKRSLGSRLHEALCGFSGGVMIAASVWSLLIPALEQKSSVFGGYLSFLPALIGLWLGILFLILADALFIASEPQDLSKNRMLTLSVTLHNLPEGMAVGVIYASMLATGRFDDLGIALALSLGIAIQNFPEGAIISMPLASNGMSRSRAFIYGMLSGVIEPIGAAAALLALSFVSPLLPYLLGFAAGAMIYAVIRELCPIATHDESSRLGVICFAIGFSLMMALDVALG